MTREEAARINLTSRPLSMMAGPPRRRRQPSALESFSESPLADLRAAERQVPFRDPMVMREEGPWSIRQISRSLAGEGRYVIYHGSRAVSGKYSSLPAAEDGLRRMVR